MKAVKGTSTTTLTYDPLGRLFQVVKATGGATVSDTRMFYDGDAMVIEYDAANVALNRYVHGSNASADDPLVWLAGAGLLQKKWLHADRLGSIVAATDANGGNPSINTYDEYGIPGSGNVGRFQYTGQVWLSEIGLYYYKARMYSPTLGRFLQTDPIGYEGGVNLYAYVGNDPLNNSDPSGNGPLDDILKKTVTIVEKAFEKVSRSLTKTKDAIVDIKDREVAIADKIANDLTPDQLWKSDAQETREKFNIPDDFYQKPSKKKDGTQFVNPRVSQERVRLMPANPNSPNPAQRVPYAVQTNRAGDPLLPSGQPFREGMDRGLYHIPQSIYQFIRIEYDE